MVDPFIYKIKQYEFIEESAHLLKKLYLPIFDVLADLKKETEGCKPILIELHNLTKDSEIIAENLVPVIDTLDCLQNELNDLIPQLTQLNTLYKILYNIGYGSQNLIKSSRYVAEVNIGMFGSSDYVREGHFGYDKFYYFHEPNFDKLVETVAELIQLFEINGTPLSNKNKEFNKFIAIIQEIIELVLFMSKKYTPNTIYCNIPEIFNSCARVGKKIFSYLKIFDFSNSLIGLYDDIGDAKKGLQKLIKKYKGKPKKKINLDAIFFAKEGTESLYKIIKVTKKIL